MSAETLRKAAALMRERADCFHEGQWFIMPGVAGHKEIRHEYRDEDGEWRDGFVLDIDTTSTAEHIASWHPAVALAVADWLDTAGADIWAHGPLCECGTGCDACDDNLWEPHARAALAVARAYLGAP